MKTKKIGETSIYCIGQGCMGIGGYLSKDATRDQECVDAIKFGIDSGLTALDTAEVYGAGYSEEIIGKAIHGIRDKVFLATKVSPKNLSPKDLITSCEKSLKRLKTDYIDLYQVHWPNPSVPIKDTISAMKIVREQGKINSIGVSNFSLGQLKEACEVLDGEDVTAIQVEYNLFDRTIENDIIPYCENKGISVIAYSPLDQGCIVQDVNKKNIITEIARKYEKTISQIVLNWLVSHPCVIAIPKALRPEHIRQNAEAADFELDDEDIQLIDRTFKTDPIEVQPDKIKVVLDGQGNRMAYQTLEDALSNKLGFTPSPNTLAEDIRLRNERIKQIRVRKTTDKSGRYTYDLVEGRIRYWAWVIAFNGEKAIPVLLR